MIVAKIRILGFISNPERHTLAYHNRMVGWLNSGNENGPLFNVLNEGTMKWVVKPTYDEAAEVLRIQIKDYIESIRWLKADPADFFIEVYHAEVNDQGLFWTPDTTCCKRIRVSDGSEVVR